ncbi:hypothetical protein NTE19_003322 [Vibrio fluvialis]|nr:hypothetical protein [Vibrio fluvialis]
MSDPYNNEFMTWVVENKDGKFPFNPKLKVEGHEITPIAASVYNEVHLNRRISALLRRIVWDGEEVTTEYLNQIGFSKRDADSLGVDVEGLENINPPHGWEDEL